METDYKVRLEVFEGPLDLLLYLIKREEVDVYDISIERITKQYLEYLDTFRMLDLELAGEFVVMAATLIYIKSRSLLPVHQQPPEEEADEEDPRWDLIRQLVEYKKFKDAATYLHQRELLQEGIISRVPDKPDFGDLTALLKTEVGIFDLINAFQKVLRRIESRRENLREIFEENFTVSEKIEHILTVLRHTSRVAFSELFAQAASRTEVVVTFLALLELIRLKQLRVTQENSFGEIQIQAIT
ncbi:MAG: segregation/condensation protein A [Verrucomicrobia bacterium]|nr:segregation/condensation protein A [Verrucomicrobiota bacterium]MBV8969089.1 segregation/condensation protein A [Verrucomicrobiota bacterium]